MSRRHVYIAQDRVTGLVKVGMSRDVNERLRRLSTFAPSRIALIATIQHGDRKIESLLHELFARSRAHGEWFHPTTDVVFWIREWSRANPDGYVGTEWPMLYDAVARTTSRVAEQLTEMAEQVA